MENRIECTRKRHIPINRFLYHLFNGYTSIIVFWDNYTQGLMEMFE